MTTSSPAGPTQTAAPARFRPGFTIMELMVAVGILVIIILSIGVTFSSASKSVGVSQATMDIMANVRATQELLARDLAGINRDGFLVIRSRALNTTSSSAVENSLRFDQLCFMSYGNFTDRTGTIIRDSAFSNNASSNAGLCWWGQLVMEKQGGSTDPSTLGKAGPNQSYVAPNQSLLTNSNWLSYWPHALPTGAFPGSGSAIGVTMNPDNVTLKDSNFYLGRHTFVLMPGAMRNANQLIVPGGNDVPAYSNPLAGSTPLPTGYEGVSADPASSRYDVLAMTPSQLMSQIQQSDATLSNNISAYAEAALTYRFRALASVYDTEVAANPFANGYFRSTPIVMQGVSSFKVEWSDGTSWTQQDVNSGLVTPDLFNQLRWYGPTHLFNNGIGDGYIERSSPAGDPNTGDHYLAVFTFNNRPFWPKALRITLHVGSERLQGGRDFVQVVRLPE